MRRILSFAVAGLFAGIFVLSSNSHWMQALALSRSSINAAVPADKYRFGDLYSLCYLPDYKQRAFNAADLRPNYVRQKAPGNEVCLYSICDSYLAAFLLNDSLLSHARSYQFIRWNTKAKQVCLDSTKHNILVLETVEREVRSMRLQDTAYIYRHLGVVAAPGQETEREFEPASWISQHVFNKNIEDNLELNLFDYRFFTPIKELKAQFNHRVFNRTSPDVVLSKTRRQLYYAQTVDTTAAVNSSFKQVPDKDIEQVVGNLNRVYRHYRRAGFEQVYLAIMPNPVTILEPHLLTYNQVIPRIQRHPALQMPVIDVYAKLLHNRTRPIYQVSDSHWAKEGFLLGIAQVDSALATYSK